MCGSSLQSKKERLSGQLTIHDFLRPIYCVPQVIVDDKMPSFEYALIGFSFQYNYNIKGLYDGIVQGYKRIKQKLTYLCKSQAGMTKSSPILFVWSIMVFLLYVGFILFIRSLLVGQVRQSLIKFNTINYFICLKLISMYPFLNNNFSFLYDYVYEQERMTMNYGYLPTFPPNIPPETQIDPSRVEHQAEEKKPQLIKTTYEEAVPQKCQRTQQCGMVKMEEKEKGVEQMIKMQQVSELPMKMKKNRNKNQYDKNMIGNIANIVLKEVFNHHFEGYLVKSCHFFQVKPIEFFSYMKKMMINKNRLGTTELYRIFHENIQNKFHKVFAFFMIKFIKEDYTTYILREGKMINRIKYIECASKMLYIPKLTKEEYAFLHTLIK